ncbi:MAG: hypothetical protein HQ512_04395 [Rhodospirillales bacterium]|nr:hypothetical protein [Rhodospirillales bacterium]
MSIIPCGQDEKLQRQIKDFAESLKVEAHKIGTHGLTEKDFYNSGLLPAAVERLRGQNAATMREKRDFVSLVLNHLQDKGFILEWESAGSQNRHDYTIKMSNGWISVIELKGCLDGNNTTIFERPSHAREFIIWSVCPRSGSNPQKNVWSGIHTRLSAEIIDKEKHVDGLIVWDWIAVMPVVCLLVAAGMSSPNPFSLGLSAKNYDPGRPGIVGVTRHPVIWGMALWAASHLLANTDAAGALLFGLRVWFTLWWPLNSSPTRL